MANPTFSALFAAAALGLTGGGSCAEPIVVKDARTGEKLAEFELGGEVKIGDRLIRIEKKVPSATELKAREIVIPIVDFDDTTLEEGLDFFRQRSRELDTTQPDPTKKGLNFVVAGAELGAKRILELKLRNVPLSVCLGFLANQTQTVVEYEDHAITFKPAK